MTRLDDQIANEYSTQVKNTRKLRRQDTIEAIKNKSKQTVSSLYETLSEPLTTYLDAKKQQKEEQKQIRERYEEYIAMHDEARIGTIEYKVLDNGGMTCILFTKHGPIIKTVENSKDDGVQAGYIYTQKKLMAQRNTSRTDIQLVQDYHDEREYEHRPFYKVTYEGFCLDSNSKKYLNRYYYARVTCENVRECRATATMGRQDVNRHIISGVVRTDNGKLKKIPTENVFWGYKPESHPILGDLINTFETAYNERYGCELEK